MHFTALEYWLWGAITAGDTLLLGVIFYRNLWRRFPFFSTYVIFDLTRNTCGIAAVALLEAHSYYHFYWGLSLLGSFIHLTVILEICTTILKPRYCLPRASLWVGVVSAIVMLIATGLLCFNLPAAKRLPLWALRTDLLLTCLRFVLFAAMATFSKALGLRWRHHVFGISAGLGIYSCVDLITTTLHVQFGLAGAFTIHQISKISYMLAMAAWCYVLANEEPSPVITPEIRNALIQLRTKFEIVNQIVGESK